MAYGRRIAPYAIAGDVSAGNVLLARLQVGLLVALTQLAWWPLSRTLAVVFALVAGAAAAWFADGSAVLLWSAERRGRAATRVRQHARKDDEVPASRLEAGLWVAPASDFEERMRKHVAASEREEARARKKGEKPKSIPTPKRRYMQIIAVRTVPNGVQLAWRGSRGPTTTPADTLFECLSHGRNWRKGDPATAEALPALMRLLTKPSDEQTVLEDLVAADHSRGAAQHALRAALTWGLVSRERTYSGLVTLFRRSQPPRAIRATAHGEIWREAEQD